MNNKLFDIYDYANKKNYPVFYIYTSTDVFDLYIKNIFLPKTIPLEDFALDDISDVFTYEEDNVEYNKYNNGNNNIMDNDDKEDLNNDFYFLLETDVVKVINVYKNTYYIIKLETRGFISAFKS